MTAKVEKTELELSCREARLILRVTPLRKNVKEMKEEEIAAVKRYLYCKPCRDRGLADILYTKLSCKKAILVWAERACALWHSCDPATPFMAMGTLVECYAVEHVWGKYQWKNSMGGCGWDTMTGCRERSCRALSHYWHTVPMSSYSDGPEGVINLFPFLIGTFLKEGWPLDELFAIQKKRIIDVLNDIKSGKITVSSGHYNSIDELMAEVIGHFTALQKIAVRSQA